MKKLIHHVWRQVTNYRSECVRCACIREFSFAFKRTIFTDRFGNIHYETPSCVLPNTKL